MQHGAVVLCDGTNDRFALAYLQYYILAQKSYSKRNISYCASRPDVIFCEVIFSENKLKKSRFCRAKGESEHVTQWKSSSVK